MAEGNVPISCLPKARHVNIKKKINKQTELGANVYILKVKFCFNDFFLEMHAALLKNIS